MNGERAPFQRLIALEALTEGKGASSRFLVEFHIATSESSPVQRYAVDFSAHPSRPGVATTTIWDGLEALGAAFERAALVGDPLPSNALVPMIQSTLMELRNLPKTPTSQAQLEVLEAELERSLTMQPRNSHNVSADVQNWLPDVIRANIWPRIPNYHSESPAPNNYQLNEASQLRGVGLDTHLLERSALARGMNTIRHESHFVGFEDAGGQELPFFHSGSSAVSEVGRRIVNDKEATRALLQNDGIPVPRGRSFPLKSVEEAADYAEHLGWPVVVKPTNGRHGTGVTLGVSSRSDVDKAFRAVADAPAGYTSVIVEEQIDGGNYRIFVVGGKVVSAVLARHGRIVGTGLHSVAELLVGRIGHRVANPHLRSRKIKVNDDVLQILRDKGLTLESIPSANRVIEYTPTILFRGGGESIEVLDELHPSIVKAAIRAVSSIPGMEYTGLDFLIPDHRLSLDHQRAGICEINAHPNLGSGVYPHYGPQRDVAGAFLDHAASMLGITFPRTVASTISIQITVRGGAPRSSRLRWYARRASGLGLDGWVRPTPEGAIAVVNGELPAVASMVSASFQGLGQSERRHVETTQIDPPDVKGFDLLSNEER